MNEIGELLESLQGGLIQTKPYQPTKLVYVKDKEGSITVANKERIVNDCVTGKYLEYKYYTSEKEYTDKKEFYEDLLKYQNSDNITFAKLADFNRLVEVNPRESMKDFDLEHYDKESGEFLKDNYDLLKEIDYSATQSFVNKSLMPLTDFISYVSPTEKTIVLNLKGNEVIEVVGCHKDTILCNLDLYEEVEGMQLILYSEDQLIVKDPVKFSEIEFPSNTPVVLIYGFQDSNDPDAFIAWEESLYGDKSYLSKVISNKGILANAVVFGMFRLDTENKVIETDQFNLDGIKGLVKEAIKLL